MVALYDRGTCAPEIKEGEVDYCHWFCYMRLHILHECQSLSYQDFKFILSAGSH